MTNTNCALADKLLSLTLHVRGGQASYESLIECIVSGHSATPALLLWVAFCIYMLDTRMAY